MDPGRRLGRRRLEVAATGLVVTVASGSLVWCTDGPGAVGSVAAALLAGLLAVDVHVAVLGLGLLSRSVDKAAVVNDLVRLPVDGTTAILAPLRNEDPEAALAGVVATWLSVCRAGLGHLVELHLLSDSDEPDLVARERALVDVIREAVPGADRVHHRLRRRPRGQKAGNISEFCAREGHRFDYLLVLDADSVMDGACVRSLVAVMDRCPDVGIIQTLPEIHGASTLHAWARRAAAAGGGRLIAAGWALLLRDSAPYWGHNAIVRAAPFTRACRLAPLPGDGPLSGDLLSHDVVEAALMRREGFDCWLLPQLPGSYEQVPTDLVSTLARERRWCRGNLQHLRLLAEPGLAGAHRFLLGFGAVSYLASMLWAVAAVAGPAPSGYTVAFGRALPWMVWGVLLLLPGLLGALFAPASAGQPDRTPAVRVAVWGAALLMHTLEAPGMLVGRCAVVLAALGRNASWPTARRSAGLTARAAWAALWPQTLIGGAVLLLARMPAAHVTVVEVLAGGLLLLTVPLALWMGSRPAGALGALLDGAGGESGPAQSVLRDREVLLEHFRAAHGRSSPRG